MIEAQEQETWTESDVGRQFAVEFNIRPASMYCLLLALPQIIVLYLVQSSNRRGWVAIKRSVTTGLLSSMFKGGDPATNGTTMRK